MNKPGSPDRVTLVVLVAGIIVTLAVVWLLAMTAAARDENEFTADARQAQAAILAKIETSVALLRGTAGLFATLPESVTVASFRAYVDRLALRERYPGLLGIGFSQRIRDGNVAALEAEMRRQGHDSFRVWPEVAGERHSIVFLEPLDARNRAAIGFDMYSNAIRREAMSRARDEGTAIVSGIVELVQEIDEQKQPGFLIYLPVYDGGTVPPPEARRERLRGFAYSPIRAVDFLSAGFAYEEAPSVGVSVYMGEPTPASLLYAHGPSENARFKSTARVDVLGKTWTFVFHSRSTFLASALMPAFVGLAGLALTLLLALLVHRERESRALLQLSLEAERAARAQGDRANRMKDEFLAMLSHELRTPLHAIIGWTSLLKSGLLAQEKRQAGIDVIDRNARAQSRMIEDLLDMNRVMSGKLRLEPQSVEPAAVVADALRSLAPVAHAKGVELSTQIADSAVRVRVDPARLMQVVSNIVGNAIKFTPEGGRVDVRLQRVGGRVRIEVTDNGEGIDAEFLGRIFHRFAQADSSLSRRHGGLGLGLAISHELIDMMGGTIEAESAGKGQGATFRIEFPVEEGAGPSGGDSAPGVSLADAASSLRGAKVLVVDDEPDVREFMRNVLVGCGADVQVAPSAELGLRALAEWRPDVLVSDIGMPEVDGYAFIEQVRARPASQGGATPAAALTAYAREIDREAALRTGFDMHLAKPLDGEALIQAVARLHGAVDGARSPGDLPAAETPVSR